MNMWTLVQVFADIGFALGIFIVLMRLARAPKDDPRLSRGLQILSSKISVLEDLSDRTENQVRQMTLLLEQKMREVQGFCEQADRHVNEIKLVTQKSLDVAQIFQDKIPHDEIIERRQSIKYVRAARLAHQGRSVADIASEVDLPISEIEFISKVNQEQLMYSEEHLPAWAQSPAGGVNMGTPSYELSQMQFAGSGRSAPETAPIAPTVTVEQSMADIGEQFRRATAVEAPVSNSMSLTSAGVAEMATTRPQTEAASVAEKTALLRARLEARKAAAQMPGAEKITKGTGESIIRRVQFPRIQRNP